MLNDEVFKPDGDLGNFRYAVAAYVKYLIRARWKCQPKFLSRDDLRAWKLQDIDRDSFTAWQAMAYAANQLGVLNTQYWPRCGSGGIEQTDENTPEGRLASVIPFFAQYSIGGGPYHNQDLLNAAQKLRDGKKIDWTGLVEWGQLPGIRADLDKLPHPAREVYDTQFRHSEGYTSVVWDGKQYTFNPGQQADCVRELWIAWKDKTPVLSQKDIGIAIEAENGNFRLSKVFRKKKQRGGYESHPAWGTMIVMFGKGTYQLAPTEKIVK